ncbi:alpha/beta hydrolase [Kitasatospora viridis]|uniref:Putative esterase n=1 Tax=Kitasatospora viridis TaxID=281105 RepID=A0A561UKA0_9ACTN|nr:alpha/beta hydrolase-fold protein [Kitasatospora viridis]TWF99765.1 putative esterase [Kitasatospora viridis]
MNLAISGPLDWSIVSGAVAWLLLALGWVALVGLAVSSSKHWWSRRFPTAVVLAAALTALLAIWVDDWWRPFPDPLPRDVEFWAGIALLGPLLAAFRMSALRWRGRFAAFAAALLVLAMGLNEINRHYQEYPTVRVLLAPWLAHTTKLTTGKVAHTVAAPPGRSLESVWHAPAGLPAKGTVSTAAIPGTKSGYAGRDAYVYLPPAYQADPRPLLPVVVLLAGQPGSPSDWVNSGDLAATMDAFAAKHHGLAPIVVTADPTGSTFGNTLCMDSKIAKAQTYLAEDVPDWIHANLQTATGRGATMIGGLSYGGTCAVQLAVNAPQVYGSFLDISGQDEPTLGSHQETVDKAFGGDEAAFDAVDPLHVMARQRFPQTSASFVYGAGDGTYGPQTRTVHAAAVKAGMTTVIGSVPGGHDWGVFKAALAGQTPWIAKTTGLTG